MHRYSEPPLPQTFELFYKDYEAFYIKPDVRFYEETESYQHLYNLYNFGYCRLQALPSRNCRLAVHSESNKALELKVYSPPDTEERWGGKHSMDVTAVEVENEHIYPLGETCETISLQDLIEALEIDHIDYLKLDCEGGEYPILENFNNFEKISMITLELHGFYGPQRRESLLERLSEHYYFLNIQQNGNFGLEELVAGSSQNYKDYKDVDNFLFLHKNERLV